MRKVAGEGVGTEDPPLPASETIPPKLNETPVKVFSSAVFTTAGSWLKLLVNHLS